MDFPPILILSFSKETSGGIKIKRMIATNKSAAMPAMAIRNISTIVRISLKLLGSEMTPKSSKATTINAMILLGKYLREIKHITHDAYTTPKIVFGKSKFLRTDILKSKSCN